MTPIDAGGLAAIIRRQVSSLSRVSSSGAGTPRTLRGPASAPPPRGARGDPANDIAALVARRVQAIDPDDPDRHRKAFRVFLESVLLAEFGENLVNDAGFHQLVEDVHSEMSTDAVLAQSIRSATARMLGARPPGVRP